MTGDPLTFRKGACNVRSSVADTSRPMDREASHRAHPPRRDRVRSVRVRVSVAGTPPSPEREHGRGPITGAARGAAATAAWVLAYNLSGRRMKTRGRIAASAITLALIAVLRAC